MNAIPGKWQAGKCTRKVPFIATAATSCNRHSTMHCTLHCPNYTRSFAEHFISETYTDTCTHQHTCTHICTHMCTHTRQTLAAEACMWRPAVRCPPSAVGRVNIPTCAACTRVTHVLCPLHTSYTHTQCPHSISQCQLHTTRHCTRTLHNHHALSYIAPRLKLIPTHVKPPSHERACVGCFQLERTFQLRTYFSTHYTSAPVHLQWQHIKGLLQSKMSN